MDNLNLPKYIGNKIRYYRTSKNYTQEELAKKLNTKKATISNYETGYRSPQQDMLFQIANVLDISINDLFPATTSEKDISIETIYNKLEPPRQKKVYNFAEEQLEKQQKENVLEFPNKEKIPTVHNSASAANPTELTYGDTVVEEEEFERVPNNADFAVPIIGDSMEPVIRNGQFVFVKEQPDVEDGEIAIVEIDGDGVTCKEVFKDYENQSIILRSINELYEDRVVSPEQIRIIGKVVF
ncbi:XRE family transcriptional regulator [Enterococcus avium]|uniref:XRE family transcriptional regulator n=1 Tax=Enterococcus avium TaxID=33945 RepID=UPI00288FE925|nr:XRE family transcriptional regulator [Enterococcus avium]MDT2485546.1 XRE family transcriptional regulator [Enterococcus avium]MDT2512129.1 XRE family transcriptional regulator [Enterococcus avium]